MATVKAIPEGAHTITPHMTASNATAAIEFYKKAFGATEFARMTTSDGKGIMHCGLRFGDSTLLLADESLSMGSKSAKSAGASPIVLQLNVEDANATFERAVKAGAEVTMPLTDMFWGARYGHLKDPFGNVWAVSQQIRELTPAELDAASKEAVKHFEKH